MDSYRLYGPPPYQVALLHGGPGAAGEMAPVARELSPCATVIEPLQAALTIDGQVSELLDVLNAQAHLPATLVGWSWGAMLGLIFAARNPDIVAKLILVGCPPLEERCAARVLKARLAWLGRPERRRARAWLRALDQGKAEGLDEALCKLGALFSRADSFDPMPESDEPVECRSDVYRGVSEEVVLLRRNGKLLDLGRRIRCPVVAIHGAQDPHPARAIEALSRVVPDFRFILLDKCGHKPWIERQAREAFFAALKAEILR